MKLFYALYIKGNKMKFINRNFLYLFGICLILSGCADSSGYEQDISVSSNDLIDQNVVYKSTTKPVIIEKATDVKVSENKEDKKQIKIAENKTLKTETIKNEINQVENKKIVFSDKKDEIKVIIPEPVKKDENIDITAASYKKENIDDEFELAVKSAEEKRGIKKPFVSSKRKLINTAKTTKVDIIAENDQNNQVIYNGSYDRNLYSKNSTKKNITFLHSIIYHSHTKSDINNTDAIKMVADFVKRKDGIVTIVGHSSSRSKNMKIVENKIKNFELSLMRAEKVRNLLLKYGVNPKNVFINAVADTEKVAEENMPLNEAVNRRTEIYISY